MTNRCTTTLKEDRKKIQEAVLYVMSLADGLNQYEIAKVLFLSDRAHLHKYGRPITFDNYVARENGPVPSLADDALKPDQDYTLLDEPRPWTSQPDPDRPQVNRYTPRRSPDLRHLSATDLDELRSALQAVQSLTATALWQLTHQDPAYEEAWNSPPRAGKTAEPMQLSLLIKENGEERAAELAYMSFLA